MATYYFNTPTQSTFEYFQKGQWYKSKLQGIIAKFSGNPETNDGFWGKEFYAGFFRMITPSEWDLIDSPEQNDLKNG